jgi:hypothetical protein
MPFTPPSTYASQANAGYLAIFQIGDASSPTGWTSVAEIKSFTADVISMPEVPTSHLLSPNNTEEFVPGMIKPGKTSFSGNFIGDSTQLSIGSTAQLQTIFPFRIVAPVQRGTKTYTMTTNGFFSSYKVGPFENNKAIEFMAEIQMTGAFHEATA